MVVMKSTVQLRTPIPPGAAKPKPVADQPGVKKAALHAEAKASDSKARSKRNLFSVIGGMMASTPKADHTPEGFHAALASAVRFAETIDYVSADHMCEEIESLVCAALQTPVGTVSVEWIGRHKEDGAPRLLALTDWGLRIACKGMISFSMATPPSRK